MPTILCRTFRLGLGIAALMAAGTSAIAAAPAASAASAGSTAPAAIAAAPAASAASAAMAAAPAAGAASAVVPPVLGSAYGYSAKVSFFGGPAATVHPTPDVKLPKGGLANPILATAPMGAVTFGPAVLFTSGPISVLTLGTSGSATSSATLQSVAASGFTADFVQSLCTAGGGAPLGVTTITNGVVVTSTDNQGNPKTSVAIPSTPAPNLTINGTMKIAPGDTEHFQWVFNQQIHNSNGSLTVNAAHEILMGPSAVGNLIIGQSMCRG